MTDATNDDVWGALQGGPQGRAAVAAAPVAPDATNDDVFAALRDGPKGAAASSAPWYQHYPAWAANAVQQGAVAIPNFIGSVADFANRHTAGFMPKVLTTPVRELPAYFRGEPTSTDTGETPQIPTYDFGAAARSRNVPEALGSAAISGGTAALTGGLISRVPAALRATGSQLVAEISPLLREMGVLGAAPGVAAEGANQLLDLDSAPPAVKNAVELTAGMVGALAAHRAATDPFTSVPAKLSSAETFEDAGRVAQKETQQWRKDLEAKAEALKGLVNVPLSPDGDVQGPALFGKIPTDTATVDMTATMRTLATMSKRGGVLAPVMERYGEDMPSTVRNLLEEIAKKNNPIVEYPEQREAQGPLRTYDPAHEAYMEAGAPTIDATATHHAPWSASQSRPVAAGPVRPEEGTGYRPDFTGPYTSETPPNVGGSSSPILATQPETGYRPNFVMPKTPFEAAKEKAGEATPSPSPSPTPSPLVNDDAAPTPPGPAKPKRNARGQFVRKGYGIEPVAEAGPPATVGPQPGSALVAPEAAPSPGAATPPPKPPEPPNPNPLAARPGEAPQEHPGYVAPEGTITGFKVPLRDAMELRSWFGQMTTRGLMPKGASEAAVDAAYKGLSEDIGNTAAQHGAGAEWNNYNAATTKLYETGKKFAQFSNDDNIAKDTAKPGKAVASVVGAMDKDSGDLAALREHMPKAADAIAAAYLRQNPEKWPVLMRKNPEAAAALVPNPFDRLALSTAVGEKLSPVMEQRRTNQLIRGGQLGAAVGGLLELYNNTHTGSQLLSPFAAGTVAMSLPLVGHAMEQVGKNPRVLKTPATGALSVSPLLSSGDTTQQ